MPMKQIIIFLLVYFFISCVSKNKTQNNNQSIKLDAKYSTYVTAMGKGKGVLFKINISNILTENFQIDSFYVNGKPMEFIVNKKNETLLELEANYLKSIEEPGFSTDSKDNQAKELTDDLILNHQFYPSWIVVTNKHQKINLTINNYKNSK
jgi:hypothetical protein